MAVDSPGAASSTLHAANAANVRWREHNTARRHRIVDVALTLLDRDPAGRDITVGDIARAAGLSQSVVYRQFDGRDDLFAQMRSQITDRFYVGVVEQLDMTTGSIAEILNRTTSVIAAFMTSHPRWIDLARRGPRHDDPVGIDAFSSLRQRLATRAQQILDQIAVDFGVDPLAFRQLPAAAATMQHGFLHDWLLDPEPTRSLEEVVSDLSDFTWHLVDGAARKAGLQVDPDVKISEMLARFSAAATAKRRDDEARTEPAGGSIRGHRSGT